MPDEVNTGEQYGSAEKVNVCKFLLGSVNNWNVRRFHMFAVAKQANCKRNGRT